jgi:hypothetical protein
MFIIYQQYAQISGGNFNINLHHLFVHMLVYNKHLSQIVI